MKRDDKNLPDDLPLVDDADIIPEASPDEVGKEDILNIPEMADVPDLGAEANIQAGGDTRPDIKLDEIDNQPETRIEPSTGTGEVRLGSAAPPDSAAKIRLVMLRGEKVGAIFPIDRDVTTIGRGADNDVVFSDIAMSRQHVELFKDEGGYAVRDLGSGNGTRVNGQQIDCVYVGHGDIVEMGNTALRFEDLSLEQGDATAIGAGLPVARAEATAIAGQPAAPAERRKPPARPAHAPVPRPSLRTALSDPGEVSRYVRNQMQDANKRKRTLYAALAVMMVVVFGAAAIKKKIEQDKLAQVPQVSQEERNQAKGESLFVEGIEMFKKSDWEAAKQKFYASAELIPGNAWIEKYLKATKEENQNSEKYERGKEQADNGKATEAVDVLKSIPEESLYYDGAREMIAKVEKSIEEARRFVSEGESLLSSKEYQQAIDKFNQALDIDAGNEKAAALKEEAQKKADKVGVVIKQSHVRRNVKVAVETETVPSGVGGQALDKFMKGTANEAILMLKSATQGKGKSKETALLDKMEAFAAAFLNGMDEARKKNTDAAIKNLNNAVKMESEIAQGRSAYAPKVRSELANMHYLKGRFAYSGNQLPVAYKSWNNALEYDPNNSYSRQGLEELKKKAEKLYYEGYVSLNLNPKKARDNWMTVMQIVPPDNEWYQKAKKHLEGAGSYSPPVTPPAMPQQPTGPGLDDDVFR